MAKERKKSPDADLNRKIRLYIFLDILLVVAGLFLLDTFGVISVEKVLYPLIDRVPGLNKVLPVNMEDPYLLSREERKKESYTLKMWEEELGKRGLELKSLEQDLSTRESELKEEKDSLKKAREDFALRQKEYSDYKKNVEQQALYIEAMPPEDAVARLTEMDDLTVIDILRQMEVTARQEGRVSIVAYLLSLIEPQRASRIQRKMLNMEDD